MPTTDLPAQKLSISSAEGPRIVITAMFNPKESQGDKAAPWARQPASRGGRPALEFRAVEGRSRSFELMFDGFESGTNVHAEFIEPLSSLARIRNADGAEDAKRPPKVRVRWAAGKVPDFEGVIESLSTK